MEKNIRIREFARLILENKSTVREVSKMTGFSKSTIHKNLAEDLKEIDMQLFEKVKNLFEYNKKIRHIRGGMSTKIKYLAVNETNI